MLDGFRAIQGGRNSTILSTFLWEDVEGVTHEIAQGEGWERWDIASLPLSLGGMGLLSAQCNRCAANWASWTPSKWCASVTQMCVR